MKRITASVVSGIVLGALASLFNNGFLPASAYLGPVFGSAAIWMLLGYFVGFFLSTTPIQAIALAASATVAAMPVYYFLDFLFKVATSPSDLLQETIMWIFLGAIFGSFSGLAGYLSHRPKKSSLAVIAVFFGVTAWYRISTFLSIPESGRYESTYLGLWFTLITLSACAVALLTVQVRKLCR